MKLYKFYYKADKSDIAHNLDDKRRKTELDYIKDKYPLYAFTNDKKLYKEFKSERNMDSFIIIKTDIDREDYPEYAESYRDCLLDSVYLPVKDEEGRVHDVEFAITQYEQIVIDDMDIEYLFGDNSYMVPWKIFNKDIQKALKVLEYPFFYRIIKGDDHPDDEEDYDQPDIKNNDFEILYSQFSGTF